MKRMWQELKRFWPYRNKSNVKPTSVSDLDTDRQTADEFNKFFSNVGKSLQEHIPYSDDPIMTSDSLPPVFELNTVNVKMVSDTIKDLSPST